MLEMDKWHVVDCLLSEQGEEAVINGKQLVQLANQLGHARDIIFWNDIVCKMQALKAAEGNRH